MQYTRHAAKRLSQRGINRQMVSIVMDYGQHDQDSGRWVLGSRQAEQLIGSLRQTIGCLKKIQDKGGLTVVETDGTILTAWCN